MHNLFIFWGSRGPDDPRPPTRTLPGTATRANRPLGRPLLRSLTQHCLAHSCNQRVLVEEQRGCSEIRVYMYIDRQHRSVASSHCFVCRSSARGSEVPLDAVVRERWGGKPAKPAFSVLVDCAMDGPKGPSKSFINFFPEGLVENGTAISSAVWAPSNPSQSIYALYV